MLHDKDHVTNDAVESTPDQEVIPPDELQRIAEKVETTFSEKTALGLMQALMLEQGLNYFAMGGLLRRMYEKKWYCGHETFKALCEEELEFHPRKGLYLIQIFDAVVEAKLTWPDIENVGWTKLRVLVRTIEPKALPKWVEKAKNMTVLQLEAAVKEQGGSEALKNEKLRMVGFYPNQWEVIEQAVEMVCKEDKKITRPGEALYLIAVSYISAPEPVALLHHIGETTEVDSEPPDGACSEGSSPVKEADVVE